MYFGDWLTRWATYTPEKTALVDVASGRRLTYREFNWRADQLAGALRARYGVGKGDRVAVLAQNSHETLELFFALGKLGAIMVPVNYRLANAEIGYILTDSAPKVLFYGPEFADVVRALSPELDIAAI